MTWMYCVLLRDGCGGLGEKLHVRSVEPDGVKRKAFLCL